MKKIILAGYGYLGKFIEQQAGFNERKVLYKLSRNPDKHRNGFGKHVEVDFDTEEFDITEILDESTIIYMAPPNKDRESDPRLENFLNNTKKSNIEKIVYISTSGVYGDCGGSSVTENAELKPLTSRAKKRVVAEKMIREYSAVNNTNYVILRVPGIYGLGRLPLSKIREREPLVIRDECKITNLINVEDLARVVWRVIKDNIKNEIINVSDGTPITSTEYYLKIYDELEIEYPPFIKMKEAGKYYSEERMSFMSESRILDVTKMNRLFGDCIKYSNISDGIKRSLS